MFKSLLVLLYQSEPWIGLAGGLELTKTGADVGEDTATAVHWTPFHFHVRPLDVYICPTEGDGGKEYAIFNGQYINMLLPCPPDPNRLPCYAGQHYQHYPRNRHG